MGLGPDHRGTINNPGEFARRFILERLAGFEKDLEICLTPVPSRTRRGTTHAYFPALAACCALVEYLTGLHRGDCRPCGSQQIAKWTQTYMPQPDYSADSTRVLMEVFRHAIAHRGIASGIWVDRNRGPGLGRRMTWKVKADAKRPSVQILEERGTLTKDPPWPCEYSHRVHIHLKSMQVDIRNAAHRYGEDVTTDAALQAKFYRCMRYLYPSDN